MHSMVGSFSPYTVKRRRAELVRGYCCRFFQCSFPCGIVMMVLSIIFIIAGASQLIYIIHFNGCNQSATKTTATSSESLPNDDLPMMSSTKFKCNRQTIRVVGITCVVTGSVLLLISLLITKYSQTSEENNVIRATTSSLLPNNSKTSHSQSQSQSQSHHPSSHYYHTPSSSIHDPNNVVVSIR